MSTTRSRLPGWFNLSAAPLALPLLAVAYLAARWADIPANLPTHWGIHGQPNAWTIKTPMHVFALPVFGEALCIWLVALGVAMYRGTKEVATLKCILAAEFLMGLTFAAIAISPVVHFPMALVAVVAAPITAAAVIWFASQAEPGSGAADPNALFVPKTMGIGYTINMRHPKAWSAIGWTILPLLALIAFLILALNS